MPKYVKVLCSKGSNVLVLYEGVKLWLSKRNVRADFSLTAGGEEKLSLKMVESRIPYLAIRAQYLSQTQESISFRIPFLYSEKSYRVEISIPRDKVIRYSFEGMLLIKHWVFKELNKALIEFCPPNSLSRKIRFNLFEFSHPLVREFDSQDHIYNTLLSYAGAQLLNQCIFQNHSSLSMVIAQVFVEKRCELHSLSLVESLLKLLDVQMLSVMALDGNLSSEALSKLRPFSCFHSPEFSNQISRGWNIKLCDWQDQETCFNEPDIVSLEEQIVYLKAKANAFFGVVNA